MRLTKAFIVTMALSLAFTFAKADDLTPEKKADIEQLLAMTGAMSLGKQVAVALTESYSKSIKQLRPDIPDTALADLPVAVADVFDGNVGALKDLVIPIYHKHFTGPEIKEMIRFYSSDLGKKTIQVMPTLFQESMAAGQAWSAALQPQLERRIRKSLEKKGFTI